MNGREIREYNLTKNAEICQRGEQWGDHREEQRREQRAKDEASALFAESDALHA